MWLLPKLVSGERSWELPLCDHAAAQLAVALLDEDACGQRQRIVGLLRSDPPLTLWILCCAGRWSHQPPSEWDALAEWLCGSARDLLAELTPVAGEGTGLELCRRWANVGEGPGEAPPRSTVAEQIVCLLGDVENWFCMAGPLVTSAELSHSSCWYPRWLTAVPRPACARVSPIDGAGDGAAQRGLPRGLPDGSPHGLPRGLPWSGRVLDPRPEDVALSALLPSLLKRLRKLARLEADSLAVRERDKLESLRQLAYGASHELNNPLANISTRAQALLRDELDPERRRRLATIVSQAFRAHEMISDLMLFAKPPPLNLTSWDAGQLLRELSPELAADAEHQGTSLRVLVADGISITADRTQIAVAVKALVRNALESVAAGGAVELSLRRIEGPADGPPRLAISVRDSGPGIPPEVRPHIFDPFFSGREAGRGLGFGLPKCWRIVTQHGGEITTSSEPGFGATFTIYLPAATDL